MIERLAFSGIAIGMFALSHTALGQTSATPESPNAVARQQENSRCYALYEKELARCPSTECKMEAASELGRCFGKAVNKFGR